MPRLRRRICPILAIKARPKRIPQKVTISSGGVRFSGNLYRSLAKPNGVAVDGMVVERETPDGWAEFGVGGSLDVTADMTIFLDGSWRVGVGGDGASGASLSEGFKFNW